jgi:hypothetical protein
VIDVVGGGERGGDTEQGEERRERGCGAAAR